MHTNIYKALYPYISLSPKLVDSIIITAFLQYNEITFVNNDLLASYRVDENSDEELRVALSLFVRSIRAHADSFALEDLIELFEFVISPSEKVINGAIYTPRYIRELISHNLLDETPRSWNECTVYDPAMGCGGFLLTLSSEIKKRTGRTYFQIYEEQMFGVDIADYSLQRARLLLSLHAVLEGEDKNFNFNLVVANSLDFDPLNCFEMIQLAGGFDLVTGNPPYVSSRNMDEATLEMALRWPVSQTGHPDLYIPFFQIGINALNPTGILGYITVNTFIKSVNGRALRQYFSDENLNLLIVNFGGEQIFAQRNTYTCICIISRVGTGVRYFRTESSKIASIAALNFVPFAYNQLSHLDGWNLVNSADLLRFIDIVESTGKQFKTLYTTKNGIATLMNDVFKFKVIHQDEGFYYFNSNDIRYGIEKEICRDIVNANKVKNTADLLEKVEKIIFPYRSINGKLEIISENEMQIRYPNTYQYLSSHKKRLSTRDRGKRQYEVWYAFGRRQSMEIHAYKLFFPHICERPTFVICEQMDLLFYNGIAVISNDLSELLVLKRILESNLFYKYIKSTTKDYSSGYISMSRNYLKNFGIVQLDERQRSIFLASEDPEAILEEAYGIMDVV